MEYKEFVPGRQIIGRVVSQIPGLYTNNTDPEIFENSLKEKKRMITNEAAQLRGARNRNRILFPLLLFILFAGIGALAHLLLRIELSAASVFFTAVISVLLSVPSGIYLANEFFKKKSAATEKKSWEYRDKSNNYRKNKLLYTLLRERSNDISNIIMSDNELVITYYTTDGKLEYESYKYMPWPDDEDLRTPFLVIEDDRLYGRSNEVAARPHYTTTMV